MGRCMTAKQYEEQNRAELILFFTWIGFGLLCAFYFRTIRSSCQNRVVDSIGGCSSYGCGVRYTDGTIGEEITPVIGQKVCR